MAGAAAAAMPAPTPTLTPSPSALASPSAPETHQNKVTSASASSPQGQGPLAEGPTRLQQQDDSSLSSTSPSPPQFPTELSSPIPEEDDEDSESAEHNEPETPVSGRQSTEFPAAVRTRVHDSSLVPFPSIQPETENTKTNLDLRQGPFANSHFQFPSENNNNNAASTRAPPPTTQTYEALKPAPSTRKASTATTVIPGTPSVVTRTSNEEPVPHSTQDRRRSTRGSTSSNFKRTMSNLFSSSRKPTSPDNQPPVVVVAQQNVDPSRRWSMARSTDTVPRTTTPPSPTSQTNGKPLQQDDKSSTGLSVPGPEDMLSKKNRASTGLSLRDRAVNFAFNGRNGNKNATNSGRARASSFDGNKKRPILNTTTKIPHAEDPHRAVFWTAPDTGAGVKARRLSLSLPDEMVIDVGDLSQEFEYTHKFFGRHRETLGKGESASVRIMVKKGFPGELYAVKQFRKRSAQEKKDDYEKKVKSEYSIAKSLHHPNIIESIRLCFDKGHDQWSHVMEYCSEGDLFSLAKKGYLKAEDRYNDRLCLFKQLIQGLNYLHSNGIAHRDIKPENLLITKDSKLKITDFGVSEVFTGIHPGLRAAGGVCGKDMGEIRLCEPGQLGSMPYMAPEVVAKDRKYDPRAIDVWGAGVVLVMLCCGSYLWDRAEYGHHKNYTDLVKAYDKWNAKHPDGQATITESDYPAYLIFDKFINPPALRRVLLMMLNPNPDKRASISDVLSHRWVKKIECCQLESYDDPALIIDATKSNTTKGTKKIFCHNHLPPQVHNTHSLGKMPGQAGY